tara:strand:- start:2212 stop:2394 length:183 start_codon:yes stop_codon:yes gene_type:complete
MALVALLQVVLPLLHSLPQANVALGTMRTQAIPAVIGNGIAQGLTAVLALSVNEREVPQW